MNFLFVSNNRFLHLYIPGDGSSFELVVLTIRKNLKRSSASFWTADSRSIITVVLYRTLKNINRSVGLGRRICLKIC